MKFSKLHIVSLLAILGIFLLFTSKAESKTIVKVQKQVAVTTSHFHNLQNKVCTSAFLEEVSYAHSDQQKEDLQKCTIQQAKADQNHPLYIPALDTNAKAVFYFYTKKQQLLKLIFPFHYFY